MLKIDIVLLLGCPCMKIFRSLFVKFLKPTVLNLTKAGPWGEGSMVKNIVKIL